MVCVSTRRQTAPQTDEALTFGPFGVLLEDAREKTMIRTRSTNATPKKQQIPREVGNRELKAGEKSIKKSKNQKKKKKKGDLCTHQHQQPQRLIKRRLNQTSYSSESVVSTGRTHAPLPIRISAKRTIRNTGGSYIDRMWQPEH